MRGRYVVLEGGEAVGKSTQVERLAKRLKQMGIKANVLREPGGEPLGELIRSILKGGSSRAVLDSLYDRQGPPPFKAFRDEDYEIDPLTEVLLFNAARNQMLKLVVDPLLQQGEWAIADRNYLSTLAYQVHGRKLPRKPVLTICQITSKPKPDVMMLLTAPIEVTNQRQRGRGTTDRFENEEVEFHRRVNKGYWAEANRANIPIISGEGTREEVEERIWSHVQPLMEV